MVAFDAELWLWDARRTQSWTFVSLPVSQSEEIRDLVGGLRRGFGSVRVQATIGTSTRTTSIFPGSQAAYVLPVKRPVRVAEAPDVGDVAAVTVELIDFISRRSASPEPVAGASAPSRLIETNDVPAHRGLAAVWLKRGASARSRFSGISMPAAVFARHPGGGAVHGRSGDRGRPAQGLAHGGSDQRG